MVFVGFHLFLPYDGGGPSADQIVQLYRMTGLTAVKIVAEYSNDPDLLYKLLDDRRNGRNNLQCVILRMSSRATYNPANPNVALSVGTIAAKLSAPNGINGKF